MSRVETVSADWGPDTLIAVYKKGDKTRCENYRDISLINVAIVLVGRLHSVHDSKTPINQAGLPAGPHCGSNIHFGMGLCISPELPITDGRPPSAAFDSAHSVSLWRTMTLDGAPPIVIAMIRGYYHSTTARVLVCSNLSEPFAFRSGFH
ncbi:unnamed protein product [Dibothriocephalus latus]|uniref:Uncharacterized protein n=1 Tax=Dibothriocephalus latus TaxID=60516 RepID=A0A3P7ND38_DIBLA|nr:unnamed protein product [Dibothriocephalus latus]